MRGIRDGNMTGHPTVHMHILHTSKEEISHTKEGGQPSRRLKVTPRMSNWHSSPKEKMHFHCRSPTCIAPYHGFVALHR